MVFRQMRHPTTVDGCVVANFTSAQSSEIVLSRVNTLEVWSNDLSRLRASFDLHGSVTSMQRLTLPRLGAAQHERFKQRMPDAGLDCLVLTFDDAKLSVVAYDHARPRVLRTVALYNFESLCKLPGCVPATAGVFGAKGTVFVDPQSRAIGMVVFGSLLAVVPVREAWWDASLDEPVADEDEPDPKVGLMFALPNKRECGNDHPSFGRPYVLPLARFGVPEHAALDACFLDGQAQPAVAVLHQGAARSWTGRMAVVRDTCTVVHIGLVPEAPLTAAAVFACPGLPMNAHTLVPAPRGVVLVCSTNAIQYVGASPSQRWAMAVNGFAVASVRADVVHAMNGRAEATNGVSLDLDGMRWAWLHEGLLLVTTPGGELLEVRVHRPEGRQAMLQGRLVGALGPFTCAAALPSEGGSEGGVFLGSRVADSVLLRWQRPFDAVLAKRPKLEDDEEEALYGHEPAAGDDASAPEYKLAAALPALAPLSDFDFADALPAAPRNVTVDAQAEDEQALAAAEAQAQEFVKQGRYSAAATTRARAQNAVAERRRQRANAAVPRDLDLVAVGTKSRAGAEVCVVQSGLRADLCAEVAVHDCSGLWAVPRALVVSDSARTRVLAVGDDGVLRAQASSALAMDAPSLFVGHCAAGTLQVLAHSVRLVGGSSGEETAQWRHGLTVSSASMELAVLALVGHAGQVALVRARGDGRLVPVACAHVEAAAAASVFVDLDGALMLALVRAGTTEPHAGELEIYAVGEEALGPCVFRSAQALPLGPMLLAPGEADRLATHDQGVAAGVLANCRVLDICVAALGPHASTGSAPSAVALAASAASARNTHVLTLVAALGDGEVVVYAQRPQSGDWARADHGVVTRGLRGRSARPRKFAQPQGAKAFTGPLLTRLRGVGGADCVFFAGQRPVFVVAGLGGAPSVVALASTVAAPLPAPVAPPLQADEHRAPGPVPAPADVYKARGPVHALCAFGDLPGVDFVYALRAPEPRTAVQGPLKSTALRFCGALPLSGGRGAAEVGQDGLPAAKARLPSGWCATRVCFLPLASRGGPEEMQLGLHAPTFAVAVTRSVRLKVEEADEALDAPELRPAAALGGAPAPVGQACAVQLVRSPDWQRALSTFELDVDERVLCMCTANLAVPSDAAPAAQTAAATATGGRSQTRNNTSTPVARVTRPGLIIVGTGRVIAQGEDGYATGRLLVLDVEHARDPQLSEAQADETRTVDARPATMPQLRLIASTEQRAPVSAVCVLEGKVLAAMGNVPCSVKLLELNPQSERLVPVGFYDSPTCVVSMSVVKDTYVLIADMFRSIHFLRWRDRQFTLWARSFEPCRVLASEFVVDGGLLGIAACDDAANLRLWHFDPDNQKQVLSVRGELHLGDKATRMRARRLLPLPPLVDERGAEAPPQRWSLTLCTLGGAVGALVPVDEKVFRRLDLLASAMTASALVSRNAGLNPRAGAAVRLPASTQRRPRGNILDGRLLWRFVALERVAQRKLALSIGSTVEALLDDLLAVDLLLQW